MSALDAGPPPLSAMEAAVATVVDAVGADAHEQVAVSAALVAGRG